MDKRVLDETIAYVQRELTRIHNELTWADGSQAESFKMRKARLAAELERLEMIRRSMPSQHAGNHMR